MSLLDRYNLRPRKANDPLSLRGRRRRLKLLGSILVGTSILSLVQERSQIAPGQQVLKSWVEVRNLHDFTLRDLYICAPFVSFLTSGTSFSRPSDWNDLNNSIEGIAGGGAGGACTQSGCCPAISGGGGGGGAWAKATNVTLASSTSYAIGAAAGNTSFNSTTMLAIGGTAASAGTAGTGGAAASCRGGAGGGTLNPGTSFARSGGDGAAGNNISGNASGAGGGGAGGPNGAGNNGSQGGNNVGGSGGSGDAGTGGAGGGSNTAGSNGTAEWTSNPGGSTAGSGGGGGGASFIGVTGQQGGLYGAAGGGGGGTGGGGGGAGRAGIIVITWTPALVSGPDLRMAKMRLAPVVLLASLRQNYDTSSITVPTQPETNTHFIARTAPNVMKLLPGLRQSFQEDIPPVGPEINFIGRTAPYNITVIPGLRQNPDTSIPGPLPPQIEAQPHFVGKFVPRVLSSLALYRHNLDAEFSTDDRNMHFIGKFNVTPILLLNTIRQNFQNPPTDPNFLPPQQSTPTYSIGRFKPTVMTILMSYSRDTIPTDFDSTGPQPETNVHFVAKMTVTFPKYLPLLRQNPSSSATSGAVQPETNINFIGKFTPILPKLLLSYRTNWASDFDSTSNQPSTPIYFIQKFKPGVMLLLPALRHNWPTDFDSTANQPSTPVNFIGPFRQIQPTSLPLYRFNYHPTDPDFLVPQYETNLNFIGRFQPGAMRLMASLRHNTADPSTTAIALAPNPHFVGRMTPAQLRLLQALRQNAGAGDFDPVLTAPSVVGRLRPVAITSIPGLRQNAPSDILTVGMVPAPPLMRMIIARPVLLAPLIQNQANDANPPVLEINPSFIGRYSPGKLLASLPLLRQNVADARGASLAADNVPSFLGRFIQPRINLLRSLREWAGFETRLILDPNYIAAGEPRYTVVGDARELIAAADPRDRIILGIANNVAQTNALQPPIDATVEIETVTFDFGRILVPTAIVTAILSITCTVSQLQSTATDPSPQSRIINAAAIVPSPNSGVANQAVSQLVGTMIGGVTYLIQCVVSTSDGQTLSLWSHITCVTPS